MTAAQTKIIAGITFNAKPIDSEYVYSSKDSQGRTIDRNIIININHYPVLFDAVTYIFEFCSPCKRKTIHHKIDSIPKYQIELRIYKSIIDLLNFMIVE